MSSKTSSILLTTGAACAVTLASIFGTVLIGGTSLVIGGVMLTLGAADAWINTRSFEPPDCAGPGSILGGALLGTFASLMMYGMNFQQSPESGLSPPSGMIKKQIEAASPHGCVPTFSVGPCSY